MGTTIEVVLYARSGCRLCEEVRGAIELLNRDFDFTLREVDIDSDPALRERYRLAIPVVFLNGEEAARGRIDSERIRRAMEGTGRNRES